MKNLTRLAMINFLVIALVVWGFSNLQTKPAEQTVVVSQIQITVTPQAVITQKPIINKTPVNNLTNTPTKTIIPTFAPSLISQVPQHNSQSDCWVTYQGGIYNITGYFGNHPGGDQLLAQVCGRDITGPFNALPHSSKARRILETYKIQ